MSATQEKPAAASAEPQAAGAVAVVERMAPQRLVVESAIPVLDTGMFDHMMRIAKVMANSGLVPAHLNAVRRVSGRDEPIEAQEALSNCFLVVNQSVRWKMDPFAVAQHTFVTKGKIGYEGKLIAAVINTHPMLIKRLSYRFDGEGPKRKVVVTGRLAADGEDRDIEGTFSQWRTLDKSGQVNESWAKSPDQMLAYRGAREWARRWLPEAILGVYADDELEQFETTGRTVAGDQAPQRGAAGLKAALTTGDADTTVPGEPKAKPAGTIGDRDKFIERFKGCADVEILDLALDMVREFEWTAADQAVIDEAYKKRLAELGGAA